MQYASPSDACPVMTKRQTESPKNTIRLFSTRFANVDVAPAAQDIAICDNCLEMARRHRCGARANLVHIPDEQLVELLGEFSHRAPRVHQQQGDRGLEKVMPGNKSTEFLVRYSAAGSRARLHTTWAISRANRNHVEVVVLRILEKRVRRCHPVKL